MLFFSRRAFTALNEDTHRQHEPHFLLTTEVPLTPTPTAEAQEVGGDSGSAAGDGRKRSPLVNLVDDYTAKILRENNKSPPPASPRAATGPTRPTVWNKEKDSGRRTSHGGGGLV